LARTLTWRKGGIHSHSGKEDSIYPFPVFQFIPFILSLAIASLQEFVLIIIETITIISLKLDRAGCCSLGVSLKVLWFFENAAASFANLHKMMFVQMLPMFS
jgi:hypothetical protein